MGLKFGTSRLTVFIHYTTTKVRDSIHTSASLISSLSSILSTVKHPWLMLSYMAGSSLISRASVIWVDMRMKPNIAASTSKGVNER